jgi:hypothetical protein
MHGIEHDGGYVRVELGRDANGRRERRAEKLNPLGDERRKYYRAWLTPLSAAEREHLLDEISRAHA